MAILSKKYNWLLLFYSGLAFSPLAVFGGLWGDSYLHVIHHIPITKAALLTSMSFLGLATGGPFFGAISDRTGRHFAVMAVGVLLSMVALLAGLYLPVPNWLVGVFLFFFGFGTGAFILGYTVGIELNAIALSATVIAFINTGDAIFGAFSEPLVGRILDIFWKGKYEKGAAYFGAHDFHIALVILPIYLLLAFVFLMLMRKSIPER